MLHYMESSTYFWKTGVPRGNFGNGSLDSWLFSCMFIYCQHMIQKMFKYCPIQCLYIVQILPKILLKSCPNFMTNLFSLFCQLRKAMKVTFLKSDISWRRCQMFIEGKKRFFSFWWPFTKMLNKKVWLLFKFYTMLLWYYCVPSTSKHIPPPIPKIPFIFWHLA